MGTGGFGGGSGSLGGGSSGSGRSRAGGNTGSSGSGGSLLRAITHLRDIARMLTADGDQARLTREINALLRERGRASFMALVTRRRLCDHAARPPASAQRQDSNGKLVGYSR